MKRMHAARRAFDDGVAAATKKQQQRQVRLHGGSHGRVSCGACGRPVGLVQRAPWPRWSCDLCGTTYLATARGSEPMWGCSDVKRCGWAICQVCHRHCDDEARQSARRVGEQREVDRAGKRPKHREEPPPKETATVASAPDGVGEFRQFMTTTFSEETLGDADGVDPELQWALLVSASEKDAGAAVADARERLKHVMELYRARAVPVRGDGNCQFRALAQQLYHDEDHHGAARARVLQQLKATPDRYMQFVDEPFSRYLERLACNGEWGDNVTLQAASDAFGVQIQVFTDMPEAPLVEVCPVGGAIHPAQKPLCLTFLTEIHYDAAQVC